jgi:hypothetical protein
MRVRITKETVHGNPGERRVLPVGALAVVVPADNLPPDSPIKFWAKPLITGAAGGWPTETAQWAEDVGVGLAADDFERIGSNVVNSQPVAVTLPYGDWHVICGWLEAVERDSKMHMPLAAKDLAQKLRGEIFPV